MRKANDSHHIVGDGAEFSMEGRFENMEAV